jgi:hypothetical protein
MHTPNVSKPPSFFLSIQQHFVNKSAVLTAKGISSSSNQQDTHLPATIKTKHI